jgi:hypothetical protein
LINGGGQWNGNVPIPVFRNLAAALGVVDPVDVRAATYAADLLDELPATPYPFTVNATLARQGQDLFAKNCADCHQPNNGRVYTELGTSLARADVVNSIMVIAARSTYAKACPSGTTVNLYGRSVKPCDEFKGVPLAGKDYLVMRRRAEQHGYNATSLNGVWASAPYLHNGSVPTLFHLLMPGARPKEFIKGSLDYDKEMVGFAWSQGARGGYHFDTSAFHALSNAGHDRNVTLDGKTYKLDWTYDPAGVKALIEYLKTL